MMRSCKYFTHMSRIPTLTSNQIINLIINDLFVLVWVIEGNECLTLLNQHFFYLVVVSYVGGSSARGQNTLTCHNNWCIHYSKGYSTIHSPASIASMLLYYFLIRVIRLYSRTCVIQKLYFLCSQIHIEK